jgi:hypothetical protein
VPLCFPSPLLTSINLPVPPVAQKEHRGAEGDQHDENAQADAETREIPGSAFTAAADDHVHRDGDEQFQQTAGQ